MHEQQMVRMMRRYKISVVFHSESGQWIAYHSGDISWDPPSGDMLLSGAVHSSHTGIKMQHAVEDYCNARGLEWDK